MIEKIGHYSLTVPGSVYDEEALTALELAARTANKVNEIVEDFNVLDKKTNNFIEGSETTIKNGVDDWLKKHPEATTTVQDGSLEVSKLTEDAKLYLMKDYKTPQMYGAKGDGETDDTEAIQNMIDDTPKGGVVYFPQGKYIISKPLLIPSFIIVKGENAYGTSIVKTGNAVDDVYGVDAVMVLMIADADTRPYNESTTVQGLSISSENNSQYGVYSATAASHFIFEEMHVWNVKCGFYFAHGGWVSEMANIDIGDVEYGIRFFDTGTSTNLRNIYVMSATEVAYDFNGLQYSNWQNVCADWCTKDVYRFTFCNITINGIGSECKQATRTITVNNSNITITNGTLFTNLTNNNFKLLQINGSTLTLEAITLDSFDDNKKVCAGMLMDLGTGATVNIVECDFSRTTFTTPNNNYGSISNIVNVKQRGCTFAFYDNYSSLGAGTPFNDVKKFMPTNTFMNGIHSGAVNGPNNGIGGADISWGRQRMCGDIFINTQPALSGIAFFQQKTSGTTHTLASPIVSIVANVFHFSSLKGDPYAEAFGCQIKNGETITNGTKTTTITAIDTVNNTITVADATGFSVGDTITFNQGKGFIRDHQYMPVQGILTGNTASRPTKPRTGLQYFDTTIGKPIWYTGSKWVDSTGTSV